jgi:NADPH:quinone reductase-like Zn-dependent oxidoreductase
VRRSHDGPDLPARRGPPPARTEYPYQWRVGGDRHVRRSTGAALRCGGDGVCSAANAALVRSLGAQRVIDYNREAFTHDGHTYDVIFDAVGKSSFGRCQDALKPGGVYMTAVPSLGILAQMARTRLGGGKRAVFAATGFSQSREKLDFLKGLLAKGELRSVVDRTYPLADIAAAHRYVETGRKRGNLVVKVAGTY